MILGFSDLVKSTRLEALRGLLDGGLIDCYSAPQPAFGAAPGAAVLIGSIPFGTPAGQVTLPALAIAVPIEGQCIAAGDIAWCRLRNASGAWLIDGDAGLANSSAVLWFDRLNVYPGAWIRLIGGSFVEP